MRRRTLLWGLWCDLSVLVVFGVIWERSVFLTFLYKIHGFRQGILCFREDTTFELVVIFDDSCV